MPPIPLPPRGLSFPDQQGEIPLKGLLRVSSPRAPPAPPTPPLPPPFIFPPHFPPPLPSFSPSLSSLLLWFWKMNLVHAGWMLYH